MPAQFHPISSSIHLPKGCKATHTQQNTYYIVPTIPQNCPQNLCPINKQMSSYSLLHLISQNGLNSQNGMAFGQRLPVEPLGELLAFIPFHMAGKMGIPAHSFGVKIQEIIRNLNNK
jgi:hypothetical protein